MRGLQALNVTSESYGKLTVPILLSKLPEDIQLIISRQKKEETWSLDNLLEALTEEITARERCAVNSKLSTEERRSSTKQPTTASALFSVDKKGPNCTYCRKSHPSSNCPNVTNIAARKQILRTSDSCFKCLKKNHLARNCASNGHCFKCPGKHHVSLCQQNNTQPTFPTPFRKQEEKIESRAGSKESEAEVSHQNYVGVNGGVLLQTARAGLASHEEPHGGIVVCLIFDTGTQRTYLTERARDAPNLVTVHKVPMMIKTFGLDNETVQICDLVRFIVKSSEGDSQYLLKLM